MGLDIALGLVVLMAAVRGWFRGFLIQAVRLGGLVGAVYAAEPIRDYGRPYVAKYLASVRPELLDRLLWWASAVLTYVVSVGIVTLAIKMRRRRALGEPEPNRADQFAGLLLGGLKGALVVAFVAAGLQRYAVPRVKGVDWADEQAKESYALRWEAQYQPARKIWHAPPVQHFVAHVRRMGLRESDAESPKPETRTEESPVQAAAIGGPPRLEIVLPTLDAASSDFAREFDRAWQALETEGDRKD